MLLRLPNELIIKIFGFLDPDSADEFGYACVKSNSIANDVNARAFMLMNYYGKGQVFYKTYAKYRTKLDEQMATIYLHNNVILPRFLAQLVLKDFSNDSTKVDPGLYALIVKNAYDLYGSEVLFNENDHLTFDMLLRGSTANENVEKLRELITVYKYCPVKELSRRTIGDSLYILATLDITLIRNLQVACGYDIREENDYVMEKLLSSPISTFTVQLFLNAGFILSDIVVKRSIAWGKPFALDILFEIVERKKLFKLAFATMNEIFGPYLSKEESLNVPWNSQAVHRIMHIFNINDEFIEKAVLNDPSDHCTMELPHSTFPVTRPYFKSRPYPIWHWILDTYGPHHRLSIACFDDAISRAVSDGSLHILIETYISGGLVMRPRHIKILACRVLHRNMTHNSLRAIRSLRSQVTERHRRTLLNLEGSQRDSINLISNDELLMFLDALNREVLQNEEWKEKSRSVQIAGDSSGTTFAITQTPEDVVNFTQECQKLAQNINVWLPSMDVERDRMPRAMIAVNTTVQKVKFIFKNRFFVPRLFKSFKPPFSR